MKVIYYAKHNNTGSDATESHITAALRSLGHEVFCVEEGLLKGAEAAGDLLLFHHNLPGFRFSGVKACWYFDKVWNGRDVYINKVLRYADRLFMTDETWALAHPNPKIRILRQGIGNENQPQSKSARCEGVDVAFTGSVYGERKQWVDGLKKRYGKRFMVVGDAHNDRLRELCASVPIIVAPKYPSDDNYWSNRIYLITGSCGFMIHPRLKGLDAEFVEGKHYVGYSDTEELYQKIDYYLAHPEERRWIQRDGFLRTNSKYSFLKRCQKLLREIPRQKSIGRTGSGGRAATTK